VTERAPTHTTFGGVDPVLAQDDGEAMLLDNKAAAIFGAGSAVGSAVARTLPVRGRVLFLSGRTAGAVETPRHGG
jgi:predicted amino acid dehydrogenase